MFIFFKFDVGQRVITDLGVKGVIDMAGVDISKSNFYFVRCIGQSNWIPEDRLKRDIDFENNCEEKE